MLADLAPEPVAARHRFFQPLRRSSPQLILPRAGRVRPGLPHRRDLAEPRVTQRPRAEVRHRLAFSRSFDVRAAEKSVVTMRPS
jgi:hypothetical protein